MSKTTRTRIVFVAVAAPLLALGIVGGALEAGNATQTQSKSDTPVAVQAPLTAEQQAKIAALRIAAREAAESRTGRPAATDTGVDYLNPAKNPYRQH